MKTPFAAGTSGREQLMLNSAFFLLFPGFFYYHTLLGTGAMGPVLGGYFSPISILYMVPLAITYYLRMRRDRRRLSAIDLHYAVFMAYFVFIVAIHVVTGANPLIVRDHLLCILFMVIVFVLFTFIDFGHPQFRNMAFVALAAMSVIAIAFSVNGVFYLGAMGTVKDGADDSLATYQGFARSYLFTILPLIAYTRSLTVRLLLYVVGVVTLFVNTARSEFAALLFAIPIFEFYFSRKKLIFVGVAVTLIMLLAMHIDDLVAALPDSRILELLDLSQSTSADKRHHLTLYARQTIAAHPLFGDYGSYEPGYYSHNVLSAWVDLGLFGFVYLMAIVIVPAIPMFFKEYLAGRQRPEFIHAFVLACVTVLLLISAHYFTDMLIGATLGAYSQYRFERKYGKYRSSELSPSTVRHADLRQAVPEPVRARS
jgi:hypothetical protein